MLRYLTGGESHGKCILAVMDGVPAGLHIYKSSIDKELARRMVGYGRGKRMQIEADKAEVLSGVRKNITIGSPIAMIVENKDQSIDSLPVVLDPRPGHADLAGILKYDLKDARSVLERASARETVGRVCIGAIAKMLLAEFGIRVMSHVIMVGGIEARTKGLGFNQIITLAEKSDLRCADYKAAARMREEIDAAAKTGDTLGGIFEVIIKGAPPGLGSYVQWDKRLDANLSRAIMSIQAVKGVSFGIGFKLAERKGSIVHDEILYDGKIGFYRKTNNAGGIEGGMTNGEDVVMQAVMKPIATLKKPLASANIKTKRPVKAVVERSDVCAVPAAGVIGESMAAVEIAGAMIEKFGGDSVTEMVRNYEGYLKQVKEI
jgi:chorismate synthase